VARHFRRYQPGDTTALIKLINAANSGGGGSGWTHEAELFEGDRIDTAELLSLLEAPGSMFVLCLDGADLAGCAYLKPLEDAAYLGLLAVRPKLQGGGVGKEILRECERIVREEWDSGLIRMTVITHHRPELTAFYERRGYSRTGRYKSFDRLQAQTGMKVPGLTLEWMEKALA
jgi:GNAT superfamily N-acetyltransferase